MALECMNQDFAGDNVVSLREAAKLLPGNPHVSTLHRWRSIGCRGVKLRAIKIGGRYFLSLDALQEFVAATSANATQAPRLSQSRSTQKASDEISRRVDKTVFRSHAKRGTKNPVPANELDA